MNELKTTLIEAITKFTLEDLGHWQQPTLAKSVGPTFPDLFKTFSNELALVRADLQRELSKQTVEVLERDFPESRTPSFNALFERYGLFSDLAKRLAHLKANVPQDFAGGWAIKEREVDTSYWRGFQSYSLVEGTLLSVGRDPRKTSYDAVLKTYGRSNEADEVLYFLEDRYEAIAFGLGADPANQDSRVDADTFFEWVNAHSIKIDDRFRRMLNERSKSSKPAVLVANTHAAQRIEKPLYGSSWNLHARIITAMAISKYGLDSIEKLGRVAKAIQSDGDLADLSFDLKALRGLLRVGFETYISKN